MSVCSASNVSAQLSPLSLHASSPLGLEIKKYETSLRKLSVHPDLGNVAVAEFTGERCKIKLTTDFGKTWVEAADGSHPFWVKVPGGHNEIEFVHFETCNSEASTIANTIWNNGQATMTVTQQRFTSLQAVDWYVERNYFLNLFLFLSLF